MALLFPFLLLAQNYVFGPNVRVNDDPPGSSIHSTYSPGQHLIAARGDTVYLVWRDDRNLETYVYFARSNDARQHFTTTTRVDNTIPGCLGAGPSMAVDDSGGVHVSWTNVNPDNHVFILHEVNRRRSELPAAGPGMREPAHEPERGRGDCDK